ncbi:hypothetical protein LBMAG42_08710 [Deltaproteobacteria bacterium]|nr:hypothetical protein LBMAG42_08710 [Deltaproteobacteria bacterium]
MWAFLGLAATLAACSTPSPLPTPLPPRAPPPLSQAAALPLGTACSPTDPAPACAAGSLCCLPCCKPNATPVCTAPDPTGACPLPDLIVDQGLLAASVAAEAYDATPAACGVQLGCVGGPGPRRLLRFTTSTKNVGYSSFVLGRPADYPEDFRWSECSQNFRIEGHTEFRLLDKRGQLVAKGKKEGYCLRDAMDGGLSGKMPTFNCADQGISPGWADIYGNPDDCQWVDVTGVKAGDYTLEVEVDPGNRWAESNDTNNVARVPVHLEQP